MTCVLTLTLTGRPVASTGVPIYDVWRLGAVLHVADACSLCSRATAHRCAGRSFEPSITQFVPAQKGKTNHTWSRRRRLLARQGRPMLSNRLFFFSALFAWCPAWIRNRHGLTTCRCCSRAERCARIRWKFVV